METRVRTCTYIYGDVTADARHDTPPSQFSIVQFNTTMALWYYNISLIPRSIPSFSMLQRFSTILQRTSKSGSNALANQNAALDRSQTRFVRMLDHEFES